MSDLLFEKRNHIAHLTLNRPERRNAFSCEMIVKLAAAWREIRDDNELRVVMLTGSGSDAFCTGGDLRDFVPFLTGSKQPQSEYEHSIVNDMQQVLIALLRPFEFYKPIIAAVNGDAVAGGMELLQATDIRIAADHANFGLAEPQRGLVPGGGSMTRLARQIGYAKAMEILLTGDAIDAHEAWRIGFVNEVVSVDKVEERAHAFAERLAKNGPLAIRKIKECVLRTSGVTIAEAFSIEDAISAEVIVSKDAREGPRAFVEKREPKYTGT
ncbi:MAG: enoyl-CoA hydratase-related protein [Pseudomonadota bacterium]